MSMTKSMTIRLNGMRMRLNVCNQRKTTKYHLWYDTDQRGAELITIHPDSTWDIRQIPLKDIRNAAIHSVISYISGEN